MRIDRILIRGFGPLSNREFAFPQDRVAIVAAPNESGKTALVQAIIAALYGLPRERASKTYIPVKTVYDPWGGGPYGVEAAVSVKGSQIHLIHDFHASRFQAQDLSTGRDLTEDLPSEPSRVWLGIGADDFRRFACISGKEQAALSDSREIVFRLEGMLSGSDVAADAARRVIEAALQKCPDHLGKTVQLKTSVNRAADALQAALLRRESLIQERSQRAADLEELEELQARLPRLEAAVRDAQGGVTRARIAEIAERLAAHERAEEHVRELEAEAAPLSGLTTFPLQDEQRAASLFASVQASAESIEQLRHEQDARRTSQREAVSSLAEQGKLCGITAEHVGEFQSLCALAADAERRIAEAGAGLAECESGLSRSAAGREGADVLLAAFEDSPLEQQQALAVWADHEASFAEERARMEQQRAGKELALSRLRPPSSALWALASLLGLGGAGLAGAGYLPAAAAVAVVATIAGWRAFAANRLERSLRAEVTAVNARLHDETAREEALRAEAQNSAIALGFGDLDQACKARRDWQALRPQLLKWRDLRRTLADQNRDLGGLRLRASEAAALYERVLDPSAPLAAQISDLVRRASEALSARDSRDALERQIADLDSELAEVVARHEEQSGELGGLLSKAGVSGDLSPADALAEFSGRATQARRLRVISDDLLPAARAGLLPEDRLGRLREERGKLEAESGGPQDGAQLPVADAGARLDLDRAALGQAQARAQELSMGLWETLTRIREDLPVLGDEVSDLEAFLARATHFQSAAQVALDVLDQVGSEARKLWSGWLNGTVSRLLESLGLRWSQALFQEDLAFSLYDKQRGAWLSMLEVGAHLSTGTKDQVWLACRLGICQALSRGEPLPLLLDDPFLTWDDSRFVRGMRLAGDDLAAGNQIILVTCHEGRHRRLREDDPAWFDSRFEFVAL